MAKAYLTAIDCSVSYDSGAYFSGPPVVNYTLKYTATGPINHHDFPEVIDTENKENKNKEMMDLSLQGLPVPKKEAKSIKVDSPIQLLEV